MIARVLTIMLCTAAWSLQQDPLPSPDLAPTRQVLAEPDAASQASNQPPKPRRILTNRLLLTGTVIGIVLGQLSVLFGYLKIDHATRGFYSGRLQSIAVVASIVVFAAGYIFYVTWAT